VELGVGKTGAVDSPLPMALAPTLFGRLHHLLFWLMLLACIAAGFWTGARAAKNFSFRN
jgi:hypothetical protein